MDLHELLEKTTDTDFPREMVGYAAQRLMDVDVEALTGAAAKAQWRSVVDQLRSQLPKLAESRSCFVAGRRLADRYPPMRRKFDSAEVFLAPTYRLRQAHLTPLIGFHGERRDGSRFRFH